MKDTRYDGFSRAIAQDATYSSAHGKTKPGKGSKTYISWAVLYATARLEYPELEYGYTAPTQTGDVGWEVGAWVQLYNGGPRHECILSVTDRAGNVVRQAPSGRKYRNGDDIMEPALDDQGRPIPAVVTSEDIQNTRQRASG